MPRLNESVEYINVEMTAPERWNKGRLLGSWPGTS